MKIVKESKIEENDIMDFEKKSEQRWKDNFHKVIAYPIIFIVCYLFLNLCFFTFMPYVNMIGYYAFASNIDNFAIYYPSFIVLDIAIAWAGWNICKVFVKTFTKFVEKCVDKSRAKKTSKKKNK